MTALESIQALKVGRIILERFYDALLKHDPELYKKLMKELDENNEKPRPNKKRNR